MPLLQSLIPRGCKQGIKSKKLRKGKYPVCIILSKIFTIKGVVTTSNQSASVKYSSSYKNSICLCRHILFSFFLTGVAVRTTMDATLTNQYCAVLSRLSDQVAKLLSILTSKQVLGTPFTGKIMFFLFFCWTASRTQLHHCRAFFLL